MFLLWQYQEKEKKEREKQIFSNKFFSFHITMPKKQYETL